MRQPDYPQEGAALAWGLIALALLSIAWGGYFHVNQIAEQQGRLSLVHLLTLIKWYRVLKPSLAKGVGISCLRLGVTIFSFTLDMLSTKVRSTEGYR
ncbi:hypothetical protein ACYB9R_05095 [Alcaligenes aquatilis]